MLTNKGSSHSSYLGLWIGLVGILVGIFAGFLAGASPLLIALPLFLVAVIIWFFGKFEQAVIGLLILRSSLDLFSRQQVPAAFAIGVNALALLYVVLMLLTGRSVRTDKFWWFFAGWMLLQSMWIILLPLGGLGMDSSFLLDGIREWLRYFSWVMVYLLVMQLKGRVHPEKIISALLLSLIAPITVALLQIFVPSSILPSLITAQGKVGSNVSGTLGFPNGLGIFLTMFIGLVWWKLSISQKRWTWWLLLAVIVFVFVNTGYLTGLLAILLLILLLNTAKITPLRAIATIILCLAVLYLFNSTEFGQQRLAGLYQTPLLNPDIDTSRAIILSYGDSNSFNWRIAHWHYLLKAWSQFPIFGYGLDTSPELGIRHLSTGKGYEAHNDYIRALVEQGIVGLFIFVSFLISQGLYIVRLLRSSLPNSSRQTLCLILIALFIANSVSMLASNILDATTFYFYWWTLVAVAGWENGYWSKRLHLEE